MGRLRSKTLRRLVPASRSTIVVATVGERRRLSPSFIAGFIGMQFDAFFSILGMLVGACFGALIGGAGSLVMMVDPATGALAGMLAGTSLGALFGMIGEG
jgi:hypothetical protein